MNRIPVLPTLLTLGNGVCGFAAIAYASKIALDQPGREGAAEVYFLVAAGLIFLGMIFDVLDGYAARLSRTASEFGGQLDSLCDAITFGAAPAFLLLRMGQEWNEHPVIARSIAVIATVYMACAILRLARFNVENSPDPASHRRFKGLPSPAAGGCVASLALLRADLPAAWLGVDPLAVQAIARAWAPLGTLLVALLMVSPIPYPHLGRQLLRGRGHFRFVVQAVLLLGVIAFSPVLALFVLFWAYALVGLVKWAIRRLRRSEVVPEHTPGLD